MFEIQWPGAMDGKNLPNVNRSRDSESLSPRHLPSRERPNLPSIDIIVPSIRDFVPRRGGLPTPEFPHLEGQHSNYMFGPERQLPSLPRSPSSSSDASHYDSQYHSPQRSVFPAGGSGCSTPSYGYNSLASTPLSRHLILPRPWTVNQPIDHHASRPSDHTFDHPPPTPPRSRPGHSPHDFERPPLYDRGRPHHTYPSMHHELPSHHRRMDDGSSHHSPTYPINRSSGPGNGLDVNGSSIHHDSRVTNGGSENHIIHHSHPFRQYPTNGCLENGHGPHGNGHVYDGLPLHHDSPIQNGGLDDRSDHQSYTSRSYPVNGSSGHGHSLHGHTLVYDGPSFHRDSAIQNGGLEDRLDHQSYPSRPYHANVSSRNGYGPHGNDYDDDGSSFHRENDCAWTSTRLRLARRFGSSGALLSTLNNGTSNGHDSAIRNRRPGDRPVHPDRQYNPYSYTRYGNGRDLPPFDLDGRRNRPPSLDFENNLSSDYPSSQQSRRRRGNLPRTVTTILREWFDANRTHPYPSEEQKAKLMQMTDLSIQQVSNWFINARRRDPKYLEEKKAMAGKQNGTHHQQEDSSEEVEHAEEVEIDDDEEDVDDEYNANDHTSL